MYTLKYDNKIKEFRHRDSCLVRIRKEKSMAFKECKYYVIHDYYPLSGIGNDVDNNIKTIRNFIYSFFVSFLSEIPIIEGCFIQNNVYICILIPIVL